jgi:uncharacterized damage-inducible protein DinB
MGIAQAMLPEFDLEMANTRKTLERVPDEKLEWKAHEKSFTMGSVSTHLANLPSWINLAIGMDAFDMAPGGQTLKTPPLESREEVLKAFDKNIAEARKALEAETDEHLLQNWKLLSNGYEVLVMPRVAVLRSFVMNHIIHHRAQLTVYLRLNDIPVPSLYGPSADEEM